MLCQPTPFPKNVYTHLPMVDFPAMFDYQKVHPKNPSTSTTSWSFCVNCEDPFGFLERISIALDISLVPFFGLGGWPLGPTNRVWKLRYTIHRNVIYHRWDWKAGCVCLLLLSYFLFAEIYGLSENTIFFGTRGSWIRSLANQDFTKGWRSWNPSQIGVSKLKSKLDQLVDMKDEGAKN